MTEYPSISAKFVATRDHVMARLGVTLEGLASRSRCARIVRARRIVALILRHQTVGGVQLSYPDMAILLGRANFRTIIDNCEAAMKDQEHLDAATAIIGELKGTGATFADRPTRRAA